MIYRLGFRLVLQRIDAERAHQLAARCLRVATAVPALRTMLRRLLAPRHPELEVYALGRTFPSPLGVAAGVDKDASWYEALGALGFGFVEIGTVTALPQDGHPRPRVFRLPRDRALLNRMGFPNPGAEVVARHLGARRESTIVGANIGRSRAAPPERVSDDHRDSARLLAPAADYLVINVSSPNTPGVRELQDVESLEALVSDVRSELAASGDAIPLLIKIAPDLADEEIDAVADLALGLKLDGIVAVNTTIDRQGLSAGADKEAAAGGGGVSGAPLKPRAVKVLTRLHARTAGRLVLISVGGIETPDDAWERVLAGATLVQAYTGFVYGGPAWPRRLNRGIARKVREAGAGSIGDVVGAQHLSGPAADAETATAGAEAMTRAR